MRLPDRPREWTSSGWFIFIGLLITYVVVDPKLIYHGHGEYLQFPIHVPGLTDYTEVPSAPGQALEYLAARLAHLYHSSWTGALVIAVTAWLLAAVTGAVVAPLAGAPWLWHLRYLPGILLLLQYSRYHPDLVNGLALLLGLLLAHAYARLPARGAGLRLLVFLGLALTDYVAGAPGFAVFLALCAISDCSKREYRGAWLVALGGVAIPWMAGVWGFGLDPIQAYGHSLPAPVAAAPGAPILTCSLFLCIPLIALASALSPHRRRVTPWNPPLPRWVRAVIDSRVGSNIRPHLASLALVGVTVGAVLAAADTGTRALLQVNYYARHRMWPALLQASRQVPPHRYSIYVNCEVNRALYHAGLLASDMFSHPQHGSRALLLTDDEDVPPVELIRRSIARAEVLYEMGLINQSEHYAHEALELAGYSPVAVQRLALANMVKGRPKVAAVFLRALSRDGHYREWAQEYLRLSGDSRSLAANPEIRRQRALMLAEDTVGGATPEALFRANERNQMAFEYLMAFSLLEGQHAPVAHSLGYLDTFDYPAGQIPRHYEEAVLMEARMTGAMPDLHGRTIRPETVRRFEDFLGRSREFGANPSAVLNSLYDDFGTTYYYYYLWFHSPAGAEPTDVAGLDT